MSLATDLHPTVPFRWTGRALEPDVAAMRRPVADALGTACADMTAPEDMPPPEQRDHHLCRPRCGDRGAARAGLASRAGTHPGVEAARLAACLIYAGHAAEARRLLRDAWPAGAARACPRPNGSWPPASPAAPSRRRCARSMRPGRPIRPDAAGRSVAIRRPFSRWAGDDARRRACRLPRPRLRLHRSPAPPAAG